MMLNEMSYMVYILFQDVQILKQDKCGNGDGKSKFDECSECFRW